MNVGRRLTRTALNLPDECAVMMPAEQTHAGRQYRRFTFRQLDDDSDQLARALCALGANRESRLVLMVRPSFDFISLVFAIFKAGAIGVLIDPGMGPKNVIRCLDEIQPDGFIALSAVQAVRTALRQRLPRARLNVTVGRRWFWGGPTLKQLRATNPHAVLPEVSTDDPAAIIFTSGSTGPPKGVLYSHANFSAQVDAIRDQYGIESGGIDLACFPLFGLFNCALGVTTVIPKMNASRPATVDPANIVSAVHDCQVTQSFASPAVWDRVSRYCTEREIRMPTLTRVFSAGAPVSPEVLERTCASIAVEAEAHTPYGATEALPVATISATEVLAETRAATDRGAGTCVGRRFPLTRWKVIRIVDGPIPVLDEGVALPRGEVGELIVQGPQVTRAYVTRPGANELTKIADQNGFWHRMGDVGYFDEQERFWYCGRMSQRVVTATATLFTDCCEGIFNTHPLVRRSALVGMGRRGQQIPVIVIEPWAAQWSNAQKNRRNLELELRQLAAAHPMTASIEHFLWKERFPVDVRHNSKIVREELTLWATKRLPHAKGAR